MGERRGSPLFTKKSHEDGMQVVDTPRSLIVFMEYALGTGLCFKTGDLSANNQT